MALYTMAVVLANALRGFFDFLARMGLMVRDDPPKVIDIASRAWGEPVDGFALSVQQIPQDHAGAPPDLSVVLRNVGAAPQTLTIPGWLHFYSYDVTAEPTPFGRRMLSGERPPDRATVTLEPGRPVDAQVPIGSLFDMRKKGEYSARVSCRLPNGNTLSSNTITISV